MKRQSVHLFIVAVLALLGPLAQKGRCDFILWNDKQLTVNSYHNQGTLYDISRAFIVPGGSVYDLYAYDSSAVDISGGSVNSLTAYDSSAVDISGGTVRNLHSRGSSVVDISGGSFDYLYAYDFSTVDISGGSFIEGGSIIKLSACNSSVVTFYGQMFRNGGGLTFDGERVLGTGILICGWMDETWCEVRISTNDPTATILVMAHKPFCVKYPRMDFNHDCKVDFQDFAIFSQSWLECNIDPPSACWE